MRKGAMLAAIGMALAFAGTAHAGSGLPTLATPSCRHHFLANDNRRIYAFVCRRLTNPVVHVYVNGHELLIADALVNGRTFSADVFYGERTVVQLVQRGTVYYTLTVVSVLRRPRIGVRLATSSY